MTQIPCCWRRDNNREMYSFEVIAMAWEANRWNETCQNGEGYPTVAGKGYVPFAFRRSDTCHVNPYSVLALSFSLLDHGSDIEELRMRWQAIAPINSRVVRRHVVCPIETHPLSMSPRRSQGTADEETPLLHGENSPRKATPLPVTQISLLLLLLLSEPVTSLSINPYINQVCLIDTLSIHLR